MVDRSEDKELTDKEIDARREAGLKKLLATPHKPHEPLKAEKSDENPRRPKPAR